MRIGNVIFIGRFLYSAPLLPALASFSVLLAVMTASPKVMAQEGVPPASQAAPSSSDVSIFAGFMDAFDYDPRGRRDPFAQPIADKPVEQGVMHGPLLPLQKYGVNQLRLVGIIWDVRHPKALIRDPDGQTHVVGTNTKIGPKNGYIAVIREGEMVVVETVEQDGKLAPTSQVVKIAR